MNFSSCKIKKPLIFWEMKFSSSNIQKFLMFSAKKAFVIFQKTELFYISENGNPDKIL